MFLEVSMRDQAEPFLLEQIRKLEEERDELAGLLGEAEGRMGCGCGESGLCRRCASLSDRIIAAIAKIEGKS
jgi:hypothetical protein